MRNNKILAAAIASALSLGAGSAFATLQLRNPAPPPAAGVNTTTFYDPAIPSQDSAVIAAELLADSGKGIATLATDGTTSNPFAANSFVVAFKVGVPEAYPVKTGGTINVKATLSGGSWVEAGIDPNLQVTVCGTVALDTAATPTKCPAGEEFTGAQILKGSNPAGSTDSIADFNIYPGVAEDITSTAYLFFSFAVDDLTAMKDGGSLSITMESSAHYGGPGAPQALASAETLEIAKSLSGVLVDIQAENTPKVAIDVDQALKGFLEGSSTQKNTVCLGTLKLGTETTPVRSKYDGVTPFTSPLSGSSEATFQVTSGPFAASGGLVFLSPDGIFKADDGDGVWEPGESIIADAIDSTNAKWELKDGVNSRLEEIKDKGPMKICLQANGNVEINEQPVAPTAAFTFKYSAGSVAKTYSPRRLRHIKNNGSNCILYNVPDGTGPASLDKIRIKIHNRSTTKTGTLRGSLYDENGNVLFSNQNLLPAEDTLGPGKTINLNTGEDNEFDISKLAIDHWTGQRAVLKLTSNLQEEEFEAFAYVRSASGQSVGNLSTGATGSGCK
jgi:hypothetical protein